MRAKSRALALAGGLVLLLAALVATTSDGLQWIDVDSESVVFESPDGSPSDETSSPTETGGSDQAETTQNPGDDSVSSTTRMIALVILVVAVIVLIVGVTGGLRLLLRRRRLEGTMLPRSTTDTEAEPEAEPPDELVDEVAGSVWSITGGSPRNAIVATWIRLEEALVAAGFEPRAAETPTEFVRRTLTTFALDEHAIGRLADLYREARFSTHELTEAHRDDAVDCLRRLHRQLARSGAR
jgi:Domain of unknown function (DUF4129)